MYTMVLEDLNSTAQLHSSTWHSVGRQLDIILTKVTVKYHSRELEFLSPKEERKHIL